MAILSQTLGIPQNFEIFHDRLGPGKWNWGNHITTSILVKLLHSANVRIFWYWPTEGAVFLWTCCEKLRPYVSKSITANTIYFAVLAFVFVTLQTYSVSILHVRQTDRWYVRGPLTRSWSITVQTTRTLGFIVILFWTIIQQQTFAHDKKSQLSYHVWNVVRIALLEFGWEPYVLFTKCQLWWKIFSEMGPWMFLCDINHESKSHFMHIWFWNYEILVSNVSWDIKTWTGLMGNWFPSLLQIMAWRLAGAKPLSEPVLEYC